MVGIPPSKAKRRRKAMGTRGLTSAVAKVLSKKAEKKYHATAVSISVADTGGIYVLSDVNQGNSVTTRVGDKVHPYGLRMTYSVVCADATNNTRVMVIQWKPDDAVDAPTLAKIFSSTTTTYAPHQDFNSDNKPKFNVLYDKIHRQTLSTSSGNVGGQVVINENKLLNTLTYNNAAITGQGNLYLVLWSDSAAISHPGFTGWARFNYTDV